MSTTFRQRVLDAIDALGPMSMRDLAHHLDLDVYGMRCRLGKLRQVHPDDLRIVKYRREEIDGRLYPRAVYGRGPGRDAKRPSKLTRAEYNRRHRAVKKRRVSSVFDLAVSVDRRRVNALCFPTPHITTFRFNDSSPKL